MGKAIRFFVSLLVIISFVGQFLNWVKIEDIQVNGFTHWTGKLIAIILIVLFLLNFTERNVLLKTILLLLIPIFSLLQYYEFSSLLNISSPDLTFSRKVVQTGFFITIIASFLGFIINLIYMFFSKNGSKN